MSLRQYTLFQHNIKIGKHGHKVESYNNHFFFGIGIHVPYIFKKNRERFSAGATCLIH